MSEQGCDSPRTSPICSLEELKSWKCLTNRSSLKSVGKRCFAVSEVGGNFSDCLAKNVPKTLVCHDMMGGYLDDSLIHGCSNSKAYNFIQWNIIDIFVYFSHHFITIPPPGWVHAAHTHGVHILGTIITEWDKGAETCSKIFSSRDSVDEFVSLLTDVTLSHNFDGWLVNIENPLEEIVIDNVLYFLRRLKRELIFAGNSGKIIWYDSVTKDGKLDWQNELNDQNRNFFDACDGIFLNYVWKAENLTNSAVMAGERILDVFVGIDVFGRNCFGGGGFNTAAALSVVRQEGLSAALFAPGWVYECHPIEEFDQLSFRFWSHLLPHLSVRGPASLPIRTGFCPGSGQRKYVGGQLIENEPWHNMSHQQLQPCLAAVGGLAGFENADSIFEVFKCESEVDKPFGKQEFCNTDAFCGGGCLRIHSPSSATFPLFFCEIPATRMTLAIVFKATGEPSLCVNLMYTNSKTAERFNVTCPLTPQIGPIDSIMYDQEKNLVKVVPITDTHSEYDEVLGSTFRTATKSSDWKVSVFEITANNQEELLLRIIGIESKGETDCKIGYFCCF